MGAIGAAAAVGAVGSIAGGMISSSGAQAAANTNAQAQQQALAMAAPYAVGGQPAITGAQNLLGLGPQGTAGEMAALQATPGYQFTLGQGLNAVQNSMASQGLGVSGNALRGAAQYATGLASQTYNQQFSNMMSLAGLGENAAVGAGNTQVAAAGQVGAAQQNAANAFGSGIQGAGSTAGNALMMQSILGNQGAGGAATGNSLTAQYGSAAAL